MPRPQDEVQKKRAEYRRKWRRYQLRKRMRERDEFNELLIRCFPAR